MMLRACPREAEVLRLLERGQGPGACDPDLRAHIECCSRCSETVAVKTALQHAAASARNAAPLDSPSLLWWRAQLRRRNAAIQRVGRPVAGAQRFALAINLLAAVALALSQLRHVDSWKAQLAQIAQSGVLHPASLWSLAVSQGWNLSLLVLCAGAVALLSGVAIYFATEKP